VKVPIAPTTNGVPVAPPLALALALALAGVELELDDEEDEQPAAASAARASAVSTAPVGLCPVDLRVIYASFLAG
jgi:hypothetical protein